MQVSKVLRRAVAADVKKNSIYSLAQRADIEYRSLHRYVRGERTDLRLQTVDGLCNALGLELRKK